MTVLLVEPQAVMAERLFPTITVWNHLEGRPRADNFNRG
jgi:hypothetical protein